MRDLKNIPIEEWTDAELQLMEVYYSWDNRDTRFVPNSQGYLLYDQEKIQPLSLGEPTDPPVSLASQQGYSLDTTFPYPESGGRMTTLRQQKEYANLTVSSGAITELYQGELRVATQYWASTLDGLFLEPITYETFLAIQNPDPVGDDEAYSNGDTETWTDQEADAIEYQPKMITADRMSPRDPPVPDAFGNLTDFRKDTRWPADPVTGEPMPDYP